jgi:hypothetical protein
MLEHPSQQAGWEECCHHEAHRGAWIQILHLESAGIGETFMTHFDVGEQVLIRYGKHQGQTAKVIQSQPADVYKVKASDGSVLFFTSKGLAKEKAQVQEG